jgi:serine protease Do
MVDKKRGYVLGAVVGVGLTLAAMVGTGLALPPAAAQSGEVKLYKASGLPVFAPPPGAPLSFADIFDKVAPAVVSIDVTSKVEPLGRGRPGLRIVPGAPAGPEGFPFVVPGVPQPGEEDQGQDDGSQQVPGVRPTQSAGSGFFISADGYIVTNNHVIENAAEIKVVLKDERELKATIVGRDEATDLAVLKVEGKGFAFVSFEKSAKPRVGDWVIAVGNPFGLGGTATSGIVSAFGRELGETFVDYIQLDAAINRGNSGGPTFDIYGRVIGVNTAIFSPSGGSVGIGFAIPADIADRVTKQLIKTGKVSRGYMGAVIQNFDAEMAAAQGINVRKGAIVAEVVPGGPADKAGVQAGDVVLKVNGKTVTSSSEMTREVAKTVAGNTMILDILREGKPKSIEVKAGVRPSEAQLNGKAPSAPTESEPDGPRSQRPTVLGLMVGPLDSAARARYRVPETVRGVLVEGVNPASDAGQKGLRAGDVLVRVADKGVSSPQEVIAAVDGVKASGRESVLLLVHRKGRTLFVLIKIAK